MTPKITFEEHFMAPGFEKHSAAFLKLIPRDQAEILTRRLGDFDGERLETMDRGGITRSIISLTGPGAQGEAPEDAVDAAKGANDFLAGKISKNPARLGGLATLPMHDPDAAARELNRAVGELGLQGCLVNSHTHGTYYEGVEYDPFWSEVERLGVPFYLHPSNAYATPHVLGGMPVLQGATWGWGVETGSHALRILFGGVFDRFPKVKLVLGHMGEALPFLRWRYDSRFQAYPMGVSLERAPSAYFGSNILITTSGVCSHPSLMGAIGEMGEDAVMFSIDYPYEDTDLAVEFIESAPLSEVARAKVCHDNAARLFGLPTLAEKDGN
ncbi:putative TIM-barrel fold metal-dependent hydrolase [Hoeflea sp. IMCC20628]|uniref:amidohydrolase family protein n=1 Tax=Hoeflea sp. IMCC20628 TaxID=1620421 RepID=UPI00063BD447|nr:amidohydrolase family protein [Hoeflea sp. IMCC20628]AKI02220.1 putative TIM-barrel fold metal-dependent hydrolase [Hoeflea sp. IMCC20628]